MTLNSEQLTAIFSDKETIILNAIAGSGKTTTLIGFAESNIYSKILYIVFNKNMRKEALKKFPKNTEIHTINSLAYYHTKEMFGSRTLISEFSVKQFIELIPSLKIIYTKNKKAGINKAIEYISIFKNFLSDSREFIDHEVFDFYEKIINNDSGLPITHSVILKYFSINFDLNSLNYDHVLIDEAQDINEQMLIILNKIKGRKFYVGDPKQSIYGFRNTINIFNKYNRKEQYSLTGSFRFGKNIANFISEKTSIAYDEDFLINGLSDIDGELIINNQKEISGPYSAYITRTNAHLFDKAFEYSENSKKVSIPFDWYDLKNLLLDAYYLNIGLTRKISKNSIFLKYESFSVLRDISDSGGDIELSFVIKIIDKYGISLPEKIQQLEQNLSSPRYADTIFLTAHKSKGLEFYSVELGSDFKKYEKKTSIEEKNLIYVAMTRAMEVLKVNNPII